MFRSSTHLMLEQRVDILLAHHVTLDENPVHARLDEVGSAHVPHADLQGQVTFLLHDASVARKHQCVATMLGPRQLQEKRRI